RQDMPRRDYKLNNPSNDETYPFTRGSECRPTQRSSDDVIFEQKSNEVGTRSKNKKVKHHRRRHGKDDKKRNGKYDRKGKCEVEIEFKHTICIFKQYILKWQQKLELGQDTDDVREDMSEYLRYLEKRYASLCDN
ncbi:MAG: hypothetical protein ACPG2Y_03420, partial [Acholeplasmataceae bacterium]